MGYKNCLVYLIGLPGVGKRTIGQEICAQTDFRLIDNHRINNVVFPFVRVDGQTKMPQEIWKACDAIREIAFDTMIKVGNRDFNYVFTNMLLNDSGDEQIYRHVERTAYAMEARFLPVQLICDAQENKRRIVSSDRDVHHKTTNPDMVDESNQVGVLEIDHPHCVRLDVTNLTPEQSARVILGHLDDLL